MRAPETDAAAIAALFAEDRATHLYGLADLDEPFWSNSVWYREGPYVVGRVSVGGGWMAGYAMTNDQSGGVLDLLEEIEPCLAPTTWVTGPIGLTDRMARCRDVDGKGPHLRMILRDDPKPVETYKVAELDHSHLGAVEDLHHSDPDAAFFLPGMLEHGTFVGIWDGPRLLASAGTHVMSVHHQVAALGAIITRPSHRGQGLGEAVTWALCALLSPRIETIGLNVAKSNTAARQLYQRLGFRIHTEYEEVELL